MGTSYPFTPAETLSPYAMLAPEARAKPDPAQKLAAAYLQATLSGDPIGHNYGNRYTQTDKFAGVIHLAVKAYMDAIGGARTCVYEKKVAAREVKSQEPVRKAMAGRGNYSRDEEYEPAEPDSTPLCKIVEQPGGEDGAWSFGQELTYLTLQHMLTGDAPAYTPVNDRGRPVRFYAITSALLTTAYLAGVNPQYPKGAYRVTPYGYAGVYAGGMGLAAGAILPGEEVARFREPHPWARNIGYSRLEAHRNEIDVLEAITRSRWNYFDKGLMVKTLVLAPGAGKDVVDRFTEELVRKHGGAEKANLPLVIGGDFAESKYDVKQLGPPIAEMDYGESYGPAARYVLGIFRVPGVCVGIGDGDGNYSADWAAQRRFYDNGLHPYGRNLSVFATQALARPWCEYHGQYKLEVEVPEPENVEEKAKEQQFAAQSGLITVNQYLKATGRPTVPEGDVPLPVYLAKLQPAPLPPQALPPGAMAGMPGAGAEEPDSPEATQDAVARAALEALGVPSEEQEQPAEVTKAMPPPTKPGANPRTVHREGEVWSTGGNNYYTKRNGKTVRTAPPGDAHQRDYYGNLKPGAQQPAPTARPANPVPVTKPTGAPRPAPTPPPLPAQVNAGGVAPWGLGTTGGPQEFHGSPVHPEAVARAAAKVSARTPTAQKTLATVTEWAHARADRHADKVAAHFGITREKAHALLLHAITEVVKHAQKTGGRGASGTLQVNGRTLRVTQKPGATPTGGAPPRPANPGAEGSLPPRAKAMSALDSTTGGALVAEGQPANRLRKRKPVALVVANCLKAFDPNEPRDEKGRWTEGGGRGGKKKPKTKLRPSELSPNPLPRVDADTEAKMEEALRKAAGDDSVKDFIAYSQTEERVPISLLSSPQTVMGVDSVDYFLDNPDEIEETEPLPLIIQFGQRMILRDGNSRTAAAMTLERDSIKARVVYIPEG